ncbi:12748_t:CDS:1 [Ambispora gerdemannii]|uniref:12748_t:CDS:1 n=1 Tax=Ambispora gerdemannii TaxID=144530 RepID=A0A9N9D0D3_9GLOM|nr:12748_t:CDS:1 [Ambispora gerdemannii]
MSQNPVRFFFTLTIGILLFLCLSYGRPIDLGKRDDTNPTNGFLNNFNNNGNNNRGNANGNYVGEINIGHNKCNGPGTSLSTNGGPSNYNNNGKGNTGIINGNNIECININETGVSIQQKPNVQDANLSNSFNNNGNNNTGNVNGNYVGAINVGEKNKNDSCIRTTNGQDNRNDNGNGNIGSLNGNNVECLNIDGQPVKFQSNNGTLSLNVGDHTTNITNKDVNSLISTASQAAGNLLNTH